MNNVLLVTDLHLTDVPLEAYRWEIFDKLISLVQRYSVKTILILGDTVDRKDRHSGSLVNKLVNSLLRLQNASDLKIYILMGNHDQPLTGIPYFEFFNVFRVIQYITSPVYLTDIGWLLPYTSDPICSWKDLKLSSGPAIFMHQTVEGSMVERDYVLSAPHAMPLLPRGVPIFSGDVHRPQKVGAITYVGSPHPVDFGESWSNRVILIENGDFKNSKDLIVNSIRRVVLDIHSISDVNNQSLGRGDQVRIRFHFSASAIAELPVVEEKIKVWASETGIEVVSLENILEEQLTTSIGDNNSMELLKPVEVVRSFGSDRKLDTNLIDYGILLIEKTT